MSNLYTTMKNSVKNVVMSSVSDKSFRSDRHILVFESDDWGAVRTPSRDAILEYKRRFREQRLNHYQLFDTLDCTQDLELLGEVLHRLVNENGYSPKFTLNFATANPIFDEENCCSGLPFKYESIVHTYKRVNSERTTPIDLLNAPSYSEVLKPQLHGREHLNVTSWRCGIKREKRLRYAYELGIIGLDPGKYCGLDALNRNNTDIDRTGYLLEAQHLFESYFGYQSSSFIPPCYVISRDDEAILSEIGVRTLQSGMMLNRSLRNGSLIKVPTPMGQINSTKQVRLTRNVQFEPSRWLYAGVAADDTIVKTFSEVQNAFSEGRPAIVCTHRVNYVGGLNSEIRDMCLECLHRLLSWIIEAYPDTTFMTSDELGEYIIKHSVIKRQ